MSLCLQLFSVASIFQFCQIHNLSGVCIARNNKTGMCNSTWPFVETAYASCLLLSTHHQVHHRKLQSTDDKTQPKAAASQSVHLTAIFKKNGKNKYCEEKSIWRWQCGCVNSRLEGQQTLQWCSAIVGYATLLSRRRSFLMNICVWLCECLACVFASIAHHHHHQHPMHRENMLFNLLQRKKRSGMDVAFVYAVAVQAVCYRARRQRWLIHDLRIC